MGYLLSASIMLSLLAALVFMFSNADAGWFAGLAGPRVKWLPIGTGIWVIGTRALATQVAQVSIGPFKDSNTTGLFLECSPRLLSAGPWGLATVAWTWLPPVFVGVVSSSYLARVALHRFHSKEK